MRNIELIPVEDFIPIEEGKYLVRAKTRVGSINYVYTRLFMSNKGYSLDMTNQVATHISSRSIN